jgi:hypothetical protein
MSDELKFCVNCVHAFTVSPYPEGQYRCRRKPNQPNLVTGEQTFAFAEVERMGFPVAYDDRCGPEGRYYQAKP